MGASVCSDFSCDLSSGRQRVSLANANPQRFERRRSQTQLPVGPSFLELAGRSDHSSSLGSSKSSSGVHIVGISNPAKRHKLATRFAIWAFAKCLQFHVNKYCTPWTVATAMCAASRIAFGGRIPDFIMDSVSCSASTVTAKEFRESATKSRFLTSDGSPAEISSITT